MNETHISIRSTSKTDQILTFRTINSETTTPVHIKELNKYICLHAALFLLCSVSKKKDIIQSWSVESKRITNPSASVTPSNTK